MRTVVALYDRFEDAQQAVQALFDAQFRREDINLVARDASGQYSNDLDQMEADTPAGSEPNAGAGAGAGIGAVLGGLGGLLLGLGALAIPGIGPVIAAGPIIAGLAGASAGAIAGGLIGGLVNAGIPEEHAHYYAEGIRRGGSLLVVRTEDADAERARQVLNRFNPVDIETRVQAWRDAGWNQFNPNSQPLTADRMEFNRTTSPASSGPVDQVEDVSDTFDSGMNDHLTDDVYSQERSHNEVVDVPVTGGTVEQEVDTYQTGVDDWTRYDPIFNQDYLTRYGGTGYGYDYYQPAYRFGYDLGMDPHYRGYTWEQLEPEARQEYERRGMQGAWENVKDAVRQAWDTVSGRL